MCAINRWFCSAVVVQECFTWFFSLSPFFFSGPCVFPIFPTICLGSNYVLWHLPEDSKVCGFRWQITSTVNFNQSSWQQCPMHIPQYQCVLGQKWHSASKVSGLTTTCKITSFFSYLDWCRVQLCWLVCFFENNGTLAGIVAAICPC